MTLKDEIAQMLQGRRPGNIKPSDRKHWSGDRSRRATGKPYGVETRRLRHFGRAFGVHSRPGGNAETARLAS
jgi:hypothetical protein